MQALIRKAFHRAALLEISLGKPNCTKSRILDQLCCTQVPCMAPPVQAIAGETVFPISEPIMVPASSLLTL